MSAPVAPDPDSVSAAALNEILDCLPQGLVVFGPDRRVILANRAHTRIMGHAPVAPGTRFEDLLLTLMAAGEYGPGDPEVMLERHLAYDITRPQTRRRRRPFRRPQER